MRRPHHAALPLPLILILGLALAGGWTALSEALSEPGASTSRTAAPPATTEGPPERQVPFLRGMTVSCPGYGQVWGAPAMDETLRTLTPLGVTWVAIHPYGRIERDGAVRFRPAAETGYLGRAVEIARARGMTLFWKPHLAYWGNFPWRGDITFDTDAAWQRFFTQYEAFIVDQARFAQAAGIPLFAVGVELERTVAHEAAWRRIIQAVRRVYTGSLTYAANWDGVERVTFWDALDQIGVQAYFPLSEEAAPSRDALWTAWDGPLAQLRALSARHGDRPVLLTEIGYDLSPDAARTPWVTNSRDTSANRALRRRLVEVALARLEDEAVIQGMFWWKWIPGQRSVRDFTMADRDTQELLRHHWGTGR